MGDESRKSILAIDDNVVQLKVYESILSPEYDVTLVKSASNAMKLLTSGTFDLVLLDLEMPDVSGFEFLHEIRKIPQYMLKPIVIVTGHSEPELLARAKNTSASEVLTKPVFPEDLLKAIESALNGPPINPFKL
jgi:CheY-like chemotaxis protein